jgi:hypothetical protein
MSIGGAITSSDVLRYAPLVVREFGVGAFLRCCLVIVLRRKTTFLECVFANPRPA